MGCQYEFDHRNELHKILEFQKTQEIHRSQKRVGFEQFTFEYSDFMTSLEKIEKKREKIEKISRNDKL